MTGKAKIKAILDWMDQFPKGVTNEMFHTEFGHEYASTWSSVKRSKRVKRRGPQQSSRFISVPRKPKQA